MKVKGLYNYNSSDINSSSAVKAIYIAWKYRAQGFKVILKCNTESLVEYMKYNVDSFTDSCIVDSSITFKDGIDLGDLNGIVYDLDPQFMFDTIWVRCSPHERKLLSVYSLKEYNSKHTT